MPAAIALIFIALLGTLTTAYAQTSAAPRPITITVMSRPRLTERADASEDRIRSLAGESRVRRGNFAGRRDSPDSIAYVVRYQQRAACIQRNANRPSYRVTIWRKKTGQKIFGESGRFSIDERHEYHFASRAWLAIP
jgi:hypothetical protein